MLLVLAIPLLVLAGVGARAAVRHLFAPRPTYGEPPAAVSPLMAWDGARRQVVMVTGTGGHPSTESSTWTWDGSGWVQHVRTFQPPVGNEFRSAAAYDPSSRAVVVVVNSVGAPGPADTWTWDGTTWQQFAVQDTFQFRDFALGYDETRDQIVLASMNPHQESGLDTWVLRGSQWVAVPVETHVDPGPLHLVFDRATHRLLLFPSAPPPPRAANQCHGDCFMRALRCIGCPVHVLAWTGSSWVASGMTARDGVVVADPTGDGLVDIVDGGGNTGGVWRSDGQRWSRVAGLPFPPALDAWSAAPDPDAQQLVVFGGMESNTGWNPKVETSDQTWTFDGQRWTMQSGRALPKLPPPATPPPPPPCRSNPAELHQAPNPSRDLFVSVQIPIIGPPGSCVSVAASIRLESTKGSLLAVAGNLEPSCPYRLSSLARRLHRQHGATGAAGARAWSSGSSAPGSTSRSR